MSLEGQFPSFANSCQKRPAVGVQMTVSDFALATAFAMLIVALIDRAESKVECGSEI